jgi:hypothetical protein
MSTDKIHFNELAELCEKRSREAPTRIYRKFWLALYDQIVAFGLWEELITPAQLRECITHAKTHMLQISEKGGWPARITNAEEAIRADLQRFILR